MGIMKTPGVYIVEKDAFPNSVVEVATAVPAFIGYTETADNKGKSLLGKPWRVTSMAEFEACYGGPPKLKFEITEKDAESSEEADFKDKAGKEYVLKPPAGNFLLHRCMRLFFQNGGGPCHIVSVGDYSATIDAGELSGGIKPLIKEQEPTMLVIPETVRLNGPDDSKSVQDAMLLHCGYKMKNRVAILDIWNGDKEQQGSSCVKKFRENLGNNFLNFGIAYYPWVNTTIVQDSELSFANIGNVGKLKKLLTGNVEDPESEKSKQLIGAIEGMPESAAGATSGGDDKSKAAKAGTAKPEKAEAEKNKENEREEIAKNDMLAKSLVAMSPLYVKVLAAMKSHLNLLPPAAAMAGVYTMVDNTRGVWKAPANVSIGAVMSPAVNISHDEQQDLNVDLNGKSINAIRSFIGDGTLVWGARTLDGNSLDWRYINVRRTMIMLEESIRHAAKAYVFEPNVANTWVTVKSMIRNFLTGIWKRGGLAGAVPDDAFSVHVGLGETMTSEDILEGIMRITVLVAISRPAEFIEITFQQKMQES